MGSTKMKYNLSRYQILLSGVFSSHDVYVCILSYLECDVTNLLCVQKICDDEVYYDQRVIIIGYHELFTYVFTVHKNILNLQ